MLRQRQDKIDKLCDIFERSTSPRKRSPATRLSKLSFFEEVNDEQLHTYTGAQLSQILSQREKVRHYKFSAFSGYFIMLLISSSSSLTQNRCLI